MSGAAWTPAREVDPLAKGLCRARRSEPSGQRDEYGWPDREYFICTAPAGHWKHPEPKP